jgi:hypothetical protein
MSGEVGIHVRTCLSVSGEIDVVVIVVSGAVVVLVLVVVVVIM